MIIDNEEKAIEALNDLRMYGDILASGIDKNDTLHPDSLCHMGEKIIEASEKISQAIKDDR